MDLHIGVSGATEIVKKYASSPSRRALADIFLCTSLETLRVGGGLVAAHHRQSTKDLPPFPFPETYSLSKNAARSGKEKRKRTPQFSRGATGPTGDEQDDWVGSGESRKPVGLPV
jgi:hypothetical protein